MKCKCKEDEGWTTIACCNKCGYPIKTEPWDIPKQKAIRVDAEVIYDFGRNYTLDLEWAQKLEYNSAVLYEYEKYFVKELLVDNKKNITVHLYGKDGRNIWVSLSGIKILAQNSK